MIQAKGLNCPNCGAALTIRSGEHALSVVCVQCLAVLDAKDPNFQVLQTFAEKERVRPLIPLGTRGKLHGDAYEVIGLQVRGILVDGMPYSWHEYLLYNPFQGFRYLTQYEGHWNDVKTVKAVPAAASKGGKPARALLGRTYVHFQTAEAETLFVMGEFPWQVRVGEKAKVEDYVAPPLMLSGETTAGETVWSLGEYTPGARVWEAFQLPGAPSRPVGPFANQPSPYKGKPGQMWALCGILLMMLATAAFLVAALTGREEVFRQSYTYLTPPRVDTAFVTPVFELKGRPSNVELAIRTDLQNNWAYFQFALINEATGQAHDFGREVSYYFGREGGSSWREGRPGDSALIPTVPAGRYYLRVEPEMDSQRRGGMTYELQVRRDVPAYSFFGIALGLLLLPPVLVSLQAAAFERRRWQESDYASSSSDDSDSDADAGDEE